MFFSLKSFRHANEIKPLCAWSSVEEQQPGAWEEAEKGVGEKPLSFVLRILRQVW